MGAETGNAGEKRNGRLLCKNLQDGNNRRRGANMAQQTGRECEVSLSIHHGTYVGVPQVCDEVQRPGRRSLAELS